MIDIMCLRKVLMVKTEKGSIDGIKTRIYKEDMEYDIPQALATVFCEQLNSAIYLDIEEDQETEFNLDNV